MVTKTRMNWFRRWSSPFRLRSRRRHRFSRRNRRLRCTSSSRPRVIQVLELRAPTSDSAWLSRRSLVVRTADSGLGSTFMIWSWRRLLAMLRVGSASRNGWRARCGIRLGATVFVNRVRCDLRKAMRAVGLLSASWVCLLGVIEGLVLGLSMNWAANWMKRRGNFTQPRTNWTERRAKSRLNRSGKAIQGFQRCSSRTEQGRDARLLQCGRRLRGYSELQMSVRDTWTSIIWHPNQKNDAKAWISTGLGRHQPSSALEIEIHIPSE